MGRNNWKNLPMCISRSISVDPCSLVLSYCSPVRDANFADVQVAILPTA